MGWIREALAHVVPEEDFLTELTIREKGKSFCIELGRTSGQDAVGIRVDGGVLGGTVERRCDSVFVVHDPSRDSILVVFVELKGGDVGKAIAQIRESFDRLCGKRRGNPIHNDRVLDPFRKRLGNRLGHGQKALGLVMATHGLNPHQQRRSRMIPTGLVLRVKKKHLNANVSDLYDLMENKEGDGCPRRVRRKS